MPVLELVPNLSEGRDRAVIDEVAAAFTGESVYLLDVDSSASANRTVFTVIGEAEDLVDAAVEAARRAARLVDLRTHRGVHVRMGALDVVPFVPLDDMRPDGGTMTDAFVAARAAGDRIGADGVPVWFYGEAASRPYRRRLHEVRRDGFEGLKARMEADPPDRGPAWIHPGAGGCAVGARPILVAFNVNLATRDPVIADLIARRVREFASVRRGPDGRILSTTPGRLPGVRAVGWYAEDRGCAQVSCNITAWRTTPPRAVFDAIREEARALGTDAVGSQLIGCAPLAALAPDGDIAGAVSALGLRPFDPQVKVLEPAIERALGRFG